MEPQENKTIEPIFIGQNVVSSKNGRIYNAAMKRSFESKNAQAYRKDTKYDFIANREAFLKMTEGVQKPYILGFHFVRKSRHRSDFHNLVQGPLDIMVSAGYLEDDDMVNMFPVPLEIDGKLFSYDKENPGMYFKILTKVSFKE